MFLFLLETMFLGFSMILKMQDFSHVLKLQEEKLDWELVGLVMETRGVLRAHYPVFADGEPVGEITSGAFSPTLGYSIAMARVRRADGDLTVEIRNKQNPVQAVVPPFVRNGKRTYRTR